MGTLGWYVFTARQVSIKVDPPPEQMVIKGSLIAPRWGTDYLLRPGTYTLWAGRSCYKPLQVNFTVDRDNGAVYEYRMQKQPGRVTLKAYSLNNPEVSVTEAEVFLDGQALGMIPLKEINAPAGRRHIEIRAVKYLPFHLETTVDGCGQHQTLDAALTPAWAVVRVSSRPPGAAVMIDGHAMGQTPTALELTQGTYELQLQASGYNTWTQSLKVTANEPQTLEEIVLTPADGKVHLKSRPAGATVMVARQYAGQTPLELTLPAKKELLVQFSKSGYATVKRHVLLEPNGEETVAVELPPVKGLVHFEVAPLGAELVINGRSMGAVPAKLSLLAVAHRLEIKKEGYISHRTKLTPRPDLPQVIRVTLAPVGAAGQADPERMPGIITAPNGSQLTLIRGQAFTMGASRREQGRRANETLRRIVLNRPFYMGVTEVTNKEFRQFSPQHNSGMVKTHTLNLDEQPVVNVTWDQAARFCNWLSEKAALPMAYVEKEGHLAAVVPMTTGFRLPTEAEWSYCARVTAPDKTIKYAWGKGFPPSPRAGNFADYSAKGLLPNVIANYNDGYPATAPTAKFYANGNGLFDMGGNVAEWCHDVYIIYRSKPDHISTDPMGPEAGKLRVIRDAGWKDAGITALRLTYRDYGNKKRDDLGFRICRYAQ
jgi:formylglycine-generating enzyme required for sulfatase activity